MTILSPEVKLLEKYANGSQLDVGLYWTSRLVRKSGNFSKSGLSGNQTFFLPGHFTSKPFKNSKKKLIFFNFNLFLFIWSRSAVDSKFVSRYLILRQLITHTWHVKCLKIYVRINFGPAGPVQQI